MPSFRFLVLGFLFVSFRPSLLRSHSCSSGADLVLSLSVFSASDPLTFARFSSASGYSAFLFFRSLLPGFASQLLSRYRPLRFRFPSFPLTLRPVARASCPLLVLGLSAGFLSSLPVPLPQPLPWCLPSAFAFGLFRSPPLSFVRERSLLTTQLSAPAFPFFPLSPGSGSCGAPLSLSLLRLSPSVTPVSMRSFRLWYSALCSSFLQRPARLADGFLVRVRMPFGLAASPWLSL